MTECAQPTVSGSHCECRACTRARRLYLKRWRYKTREGSRLLRVPAEQVREHVRMLIGQGMTISGVAAEAGVSRLAVAEVVGGRVATVRPATARRILGVRYTGRRGVNLVHVAGSQRRLQDLALRGFPLHELTAVCGLSHDTLIRVRRAERVAIYEHNAAAITRMWRSLEGREPQAQGRARAVTVSKARALGFVPLAAWDDPDNPLERSKGAAV